MYYHKPPHKPWVPEVIREFLSSKGVNTSVVGDEIHVSIPKVMNDSSLSTVMSDLLPQRRGGPDALIRHVPRRFIRNIEIESDSLKFKLDEKQLKVIDDALVACGYLNLTTDAFERDLAHGYCSNSKSVDKISDQIAAHQKRKQQLIDDQDFEQAANARDLEYIARAAFDSILFDSIGMPGFPPSRE